MVNQSRYIDLFEYFIKMIMNNRKQMYDETFWESVETRLKNWIYMLMHQML